LVEYLASNRKVAKPGLTLDVVVITMSLGKTLNAVSHLGTKQTTCDGPAS